MSGRVSTSGDRVRFRLRLTSRGGRDAVEGWHATGDDEFLKARVRAAPEDGKANAAVIALLARELRVSKSALAVAGGRKARLKTIEVVGDTAALIARLNGLGEAE